MYTQKLMNMISFAALFSVLGCSENAPTISPQVQDITESVYASGKVSTENQYNVFSGLSGIVDEILVKEGDEVKRGDVILTIQNDALHYNAENARSTADFNRMNNQQVKIAEAERAINLAKEKMVTDTALYHRQKRLWAQGIGSKATLDQRKIAAESSITSYENAKSQLVELKRQLRYMEQQSQSSASAVESQLQDLSVKSEIDGKVYDIYTEVGEVVSPQMPIATLGKDDAFKIELLVDEYDIVDIQLDQLMKISMNSYKGAVFTGKVTRVIPYMNERTRTFTVEGVFIDGPAQLYPNLTLEANIIIDKKSDALIIPRDYLFGESQVITEGGDTVEVQTGLKNYQMVEVVSGISTTDKIVKP